MKKLLLTLAAIAIGFSSQTANATILTFDDYDPTISYYEAITNYGGFTWTNSGILNSTAREFTTENGYTHGVVSDDYVGFNYNALTMTIESSNLFTFNGAYLTGAWNDRLNITVKGYNGDNLLFDRTVVVNTDDSQWFDFNYNDVTKLTFHSYGGTDVPEYQGSGVHFAMDNFTFNEDPTPAPEPTTMILGLIGMAGAARLRKK